MHLTFSTLILTFKPEKYRYFLLYNFPLHNSIAVSRKGDTYMDGGDDGEEDEPEPDEDVDLLVDDVERQDAQTVDGLDRA